MPVRRPTGASYDRHITRPSRHTAGSDPFRDAPATLQKFQKLQKKKAVRNADSLFQIAIRGYSSVAPYPAYSGATTNVPVAGSFVDSGLSAFFE